MRWLTTITSKRRPLAALALAALCGASPARAFTLLYTNPPRFTGGTIVIRVINRDCAHAGLSADEVKAFVQKAVNTFWNTVATADVTFAVGDFIDVSATASVSDISGLIPDNQIIAGCVNDADTFSDSGTLAVGALMPSGAARGVVALNDTASTQFPDVSATNQSAVFAHELGHAVGLGHTNASQALMYYAVGPTISREHLAADDVDALSYLYPTDKRLGGFGGSCGQITPVSGDGPGPGTLALHIAVLGALAWGFRRLRVAKSLSYRN